MALGVAKAVFIIAFVHERDGTFYPWAPFFGSLQLDIGIIAACAPTLRPLLGTVLKLTTHLNHDREANYYRAGKALDRIPRSGGNSARGYMKQNTPSGEFVELVKSISPGGSSQKWAVVGNGPNTNFSAGVVNPRGIQHDSVVIREKGAEVYESGSDDLAIHQADPEFKGIVKTTEFRVEK